MKNSETELSEKSLQCGHEVSDVKGRAIVWFAVWFTIAAIVIHVLIAWLALAFRDDEQPTFAAETPVTKTQSERPQPALQISPATDLQRLRAREDRLLQSYGWVDRKKGVVQIPIERAMELLSREGLPATSSEGSKDE